MLSTRSLVLFSLFSLAFATGHLTLQLTPSEDFTLQLRINSTIQNLYMRMGETRVVGVHPKTDVETMEVSFAKKGMEPKSHVFAMNSSGNPSIETFLFNGIVLYVHSVFECDPGCLGDDCRELSTTTSTTEIPTTTTTAPLFFKLAHPQGSISHIILYLALIFVAGVVLVLICIVSSALRKGCSYPQTTAETTPEDWVQIDMNESGIYSQEDSQKSTFSLSSVSSNDYAAIDF